MTVQGAYAVWARAALYFGAVDSSFYGAAGSAAKWVIDNGTASPVSAAGFKASYASDNASNSLFELAYSGTDNTSINGLGYILRGTSYGDVRILPGDAAGSADDIYDVFAADAATDVRFTVNGVIGPMDGGQPTLIGKYPSVNGSDNLTLFRVEEMHLIYAEAQLRAGNSATALTLTTNGGTDEQIVITNTLGTNAAAIDINASAGGIDIDAAGTEIQIGVPTSARVPGGAIVERAVETPFDESELKVT